MPRARNNGIAVKAKTKAKVLRPGDGLAGRAEWEAMKASRRNLTPAEAVRECDFLRAQYRSMFGMPNIDFKMIATALQSKRIYSVLIGAHGFATWTGRPRSTHDIDFLVDCGRDYSRARRTIHALYPRLETIVSPEGVAFFVRGERLSVIDVMHPHRRDLAETLKTAISVDDQGLKFRIPTLESALANQYGASRAPGRDAGSRALDLCEFCWMVRHSSDPGRDPIDMARLAELGELVWPEGGGKEIVRFVEEAKAGKVPNPAP